ncbi:diaphanous protein, 2 family protein [Entamoeba histolytica HM-3:IMSS]|uniref:Diaphanous family protein n=2 Tax=Entamoeba histolytica TaxID=5759 RepID=M2RT49_ENTHI|nr:diaphanous family protein [Entamoeba histolytica KU27]EMS10904.1 diaphanous protein, 2 family protein [Entamoeba histolytica HM-3:IMSS]
MLHVEYHHEDGTIELLNIPITQTPENDILRIANIADPENYEIITKNNEKPKYVDGESLILHLTIEENVKRDINVFQQIGSVLHKQLMFSLKSKFIDKQYINLFIEYGGVLKLFDSIAQSEGNTQSYALNALLVLMSDETGFNAVIQWEHASDILYSLLTKDTAATISRQAAEICTVLTTFCGSDGIEEAAGNFATKNGKRKFENLVELALSGDIQTSENAMLLIDSLMIGETKETIILLIKEFDVLNKLKSCNSEIIQRCLKNINTEIVGETGKTKKGWDDLKLLRPEMNEVENERILLEKEYNKLYNELKQLKEKERIIKSDTVMKNTQIKKLEEEEKELNNKSILIEEKMNSILEYPSRETMINEIKSNKKIIDSFEFERTLLKNKLADMEIREKPQIQIEDEITNVFDEQLTNPPPPPPLMQGKGPINVEGKHCVEGYLRNAFVLLQSRINVLLLLKSINGENRDVDEQTMTIVMNIIKRANLKDYENITSIQEYSTLDQYALKILKEPFISQKIQITIQCNQVHNKLDDLLTPLRTIDAACNAVRKSSALKPVLATLLNIGNFVNSGCSQLERADGFGMEILPLLKFIGSSQTYAEFLTTSVDVKSVETELKVCCDVNDDLQNVVNSLKQTETSIVGINKIYADMISSGNNFDSIKKEIEIITKKSRSYLQKASQTEKLFKETLFFFTADENASNIYTTLTFFGIFAEFITALTLAARVEERRQKIINEELKTNSYAPGSNEDPMTQIIAQLKSGQIGKQMLKK